MLSAWCRKHARCDARRAVLDENPGDATAWKYCLRTGTVAATALRRRHAVLSRKCCDARFMPQPLWSALTIHYARSQLCMFCTFAHRLMHNCCSVCSECTRVTNDDDALDASIQQLSPTRTQWPQHASETACLHTTINVCRFMHGSGTRHSAIVVNKAQASTHVHRVSKKLCVFVSFRISSNFH